MTQVRPMQLTLENGLARKAASRASLRPPGEPRLWITPEPVDTFFLDGCRRDSLA